MIKKSILLFSLILLFSGCAERGASPDIPLTHKNGTFQEMKTKKPYIPTLVLQNTREDELQKNVSASLILIISLILLL